jgi:hypothetical protein
LRYELLDGTIYAMSPAKPPHAGVVDFFFNRLRPFDPMIYQLRWYDRTIPIANRLYQTYLDELEREGLI